MIFLLLPCREPTIIDTSMNGSVGYQHDTDSNHMTESDESNSLLHFKAALKRSAFINPEATRTVDNESDKPIYDFRKMLRKTGRLDFIGQEE